MTLERFEVINRGIIATAGCESVPPIMVIAGPNGVGKSTLLHYIAFHDIEDKHFHSRGFEIYIGPHRTWRPQKIELDRLYQRYTSYAELLSWRYIPDEIEIKEDQGKNARIPFPAELLPAGRRFPNHPDEVPNAVKYYLCHIEILKQITLSRLLERKGTVTKDDLGDVYSPLNDLLEFFLPHLRFSKIDLTHSDNILCLFRRKFGNEEVEFDIDLLSSGERAIIALFMPFIDDRITRRLYELQFPYFPPFDQREKLPIDTIVIIDEPEQHLHPLVQAQLLDYMRKLTSQGGVNYPHGDPYLLMRGGLQFILATQSATILNTANDAELYLLTPRTMQPAYNQLVKVASSQERLNAMRELCGDTHIITSCRDIICIEGELPSPETKTATDIRILQLLCPEIVDYVLVPFGSKGHAINAAKRLREIMSELSAIVSVSAIVDYDPGESKGEESWVSSLPVATIENLLLIPEAIWKYLEPYKERTRLNSSRDVETVLKAEALKRRDSEITLRVQRKLKTYSIEPRGYSIEEIQASLDGELEKARHILPDETTLGEIIEYATTEVERIIEEDDMLALFHGKKILETFYAQHVNSLGLASRENFKIELARIIGSDEILRNPIKIEIFKILPVKS